VNVLVDTSALSEAQRPEGDPGIKAALAAIPEEALFLSVITLGEIAKGVALLPDGARRRRLSAWLRTIEVQFVDRLLAVDHDIGMMWGDLSARAQRAGKNLGAADGLIAATALRHGLHIVTRNVRDFAPHGVTVIDV
jgi:predicted nucleic acid-binding protein